MTGIHAFGMGLLTVAVTLGVMLGGFYGWAYPNYVYPMDKAQSELSLAGATADLKEIAAYLNVTYSDLARFHGQPAWFYPQPGTDFDSIKADIQLTITLALNVSNATPESYAYQQEVTNIHTNLIPNLQSRIDDAESNYQWSIKSACGQVAIGETVFFMGMLVMTFWAATWSEAQTNYYNRQVGLRGFP